MPLDSYSLCPGGTGKRIKFCCKDLLPQLQDLERMIEGDQNTAALQHVERVLADNPDRACLLALHAMLLRTLDKTDQHRTTAELFVQKHPANPIAMAEQAMALAAQGKGQQAMESLQHAIAASADGISGRVYEAMDVLAHALLEQGHVVAGRALLLLQTAVNHEDSHPLEMVLQLNATPAVPLLLKDDTLLDVAPEGAAWKPDLDAAMEAVTRGQWLAAAQQLAALAQRVPGEPAVWRNLATLRMWLADTQGATDALRKLAALPVPLEDAVEAETTALFMSPDPLCDEIDQLLVTCGIADPDKAQIALAGWTRAVAMPVDPATLRRDDQPPPKSVWFLLDRPPISGGDGEIDPHQIPQILCQGLLFGRQTDRVARFELVGLAATHRDRLQADLGEIFGDALAAAPESKVLGRISASRLILRLARYLPRGLSREQSERMVERLLDHAVLQQWPDHHIGLLEGRTPREAAADPNGQIKILAAILVLEHWMEASGESFDFNRLRASLGLPTLGPIDPTREPVDRLPLARLPRVEVEKLTDEALLPAYHRVVAFRVLPAIAKYAQALVDRPQAGRPEERETAYRLLAQRARDPERALDYLDRGRKEAVAAGRSCAPFDLMELPVRLERGQAPELGHLVNHLQRVHIREPGVAEALTQFLVEIGAIRPDGTAAIPMRAAPGAEEQGGIVVPGGPGAEAGKIWTPDSETGGGAKSGKLWTPD